MSRIIFNNDNVVDDYTYVLSNRSYKHYGQIKNIDYDSVNIKMNMNSQDEFSFTIYKELDGEVDPLWNEIVDLKLIYIVELDEYFEIKVSLKDSTETQKTVTGISLCEAELSQTNLYDIEINTDEDIDRDDYDKDFPTVFYRDLSQYPEGSEDYKKAKKASLLHRILDKVPHYSIKHVDESLMSVQRTFSIKGTNIYTFLTGECAEQFNCLFKFDSTDRSISAYDLYTVCLNSDCGYRGEFNDVCPKCGGKHLKYYGKDTLIYVDKDNLTDEINFETDIDSVKNCFRLEAGDDDMTAAVWNINPNGTGYIYYINGEQKEDMSPELVNRIKEYDDLYDSKTEEYEGIIKNIYDKIDEIAYYEHTMMPKVEHAETDAKKEAAKLNETNLSPTALVKVSKATSVSTVESALKNYLRIYVKTGYYKVSVNSSSFEYEGTDDEGRNYGFWYGNFKVENYSTMKFEEEERDEAFSPMIRVKIYDAYDQFMDQKIKKAIVKDDKEGDVFNVLEIKDIDRFKDALKLYCLVRLQSFNDAVQTAIDILTQADQATDGADLYEEFYLKYREMKTACEEEINRRKAKINSLQAELDKYSLQRDRIQNMLDFEKFIGEELFKEFCAYRREDTYSNSNYISDGKTNDELFDNAREFLEKARKDIVKSGERQHKITATLKNLLAMEEFESLVDSFELGNWIRIGVEDDVYRLRLLSFSLNFGELQTISVEFSDLTKSADGMNDIQSILSKAQSMSSSYGHVMNQASKGEMAGDNINKWLTDGLNSSLIQVKNNEQEEITYDKHGILCRSWDDISESYSDEQLKITHNVLAFTSDGFKTVRSAIGKHDYMYYNGSGFVKAQGYGMSSDFVQAGHIMGSQIIGGEIYSENYSSSVGTHINLNDGTFSFAGGNLTFDGSSLSVSGKLNAGAGSRIGGWTVTDDKIYAGGADGIPTAAMSVPAKGNPYVFAAGGSSHSDYSDCPFRVTNDGAAYMKTAQFGNPNGVRVAISNGEISFFTNCGADYDQDSYWYTEAITIESTSQSNLHTFISGACIVVAEVSGKNHGAVLSGLEISTPGFGWFGKNLYTDGNFHAEGNITANQWVQFESDAVVVGDLSCWGTKNRIVATKSYNNRLLYCNEMPTPTFSDMGEGTLDEYGTCIIYFEDIFSETIDTDCAYTVMLQKYGEGDVYVSKRENTYFEVKGTPGLTFGWTVTAVQKDFDSIRLEEKNDNRQESDDLYKSNEDDLFDYLDDLISEDNKEN